MTAKQIAICILITTHNSKGDDTGDIANLLIALGISVDEIREALLELQSKHDANEA